MDATIYEYAFYALTRLEIMGVGIRVPHNFATKSSLFPLFFFITNT